MDDPTLMWSSIQETAVTVFASLIGYLPSLFGALVILLLGWIIARLVRAGSTRILGAINRILERTLRHGLLSSVRIPMGASTIFGEIAYWIVIFMTLTISARIAQLPAVSRWLDEIVGFLPGILFGIATIIIGYVIASIVGDRVTETARASKSAQAILLGRISQATVFVVALIVGLDQLGVNVTVFVTLAAISMGSILVGFSIAFGLGARDHVGNLISARSYRQSLNPGVVVKIGEAQGEILEITQTDIALDTEAGRALIPAKLAANIGVLIISGPSTGGGESA